MTERPEEIALAAATQAKGEAAAAAHAAWNEQMQASIAGSEVAVEQPALVDDIAVTWTGTSVHSPAVSPSQPRSPNVTVPLDNSQSQP